MLSHCNCSSKTEESNKTCLQIVNHFGRLLQTGPNLMLKVTAPPSGAADTSLTPPGPYLPGSGCASCPAESIAQRVGEKGRHKSATFPHQHGFPGGTGRALGLAPEGGGGLSEASTAGPGKGQRPLKERLSFW